MSSKNAQIFVTKLPRSISQDELRKAFRKFGPIKEVTLKRGYGFVVSIVLFSKISVNRMLTCRNTRIIEMLERLLKICTILDSMEIRL